MKLTHLANVCSLAVAILMLSGCGRVPEFWNVVDHDHSLLQDTIDAFFQAVDAQDAAAVREMFSPRILREDDDLGEMIDRLFALYPGPTDDCLVQRSPGSSRHIGWKRRANTHVWFPVVSNGVNYYCYISYTYRDDEHPDNIGIEKLIFTTEKVRCSETFWNDRKQLGDGLTVIEDVPGDYLTCRIGDEAFVYTPTDRVITQEDILDFLAQDTRWDAFTARFGEPNAHSPYSDSSCYYRLADQDGQPRYAHITLHTVENEKSVYSVILLDDYHHHALGVLWKAKTAADAY